MSKEEIKELAEEKAQKGEKTAELFMNFPYGIFEMPSDEEVEV